jgi:hypothetical protein
MNKLQSNLVDSAFISALVTFVTLKLTHLITWSWWWVLSPIWISMILVTILFIVVVVITKITD